MSARDKAIIDSLLVSEMEARVWAEELKDVLVECLKWMEDLRASGDAGSWEWTPESEYARALYILGGRKLAPATKPS